LASKPLDNRPSRIQQIHEMSKMEENLERAINDLIANRNNPYALGIMLLQSDIF